ncbi:MAG: glycosyltransferase family 4 protein, partial [Thermofilaceae archaeon]
DDDSIRKADEPTVCFLGRMDPQKRYWLFFDFAKEFPEVEFVAIGRPSLLYENLYERVVKRYQGLKNLKIVGFVSEEEKSEILAKSWVLCLPSIREGLPISFLEALANKTAILSSVNPDRLTEKFGYWVKNDDFMSSLDFIIKNNKWKIAGEEGYRYVKENHELNSITMRLIQLIST